MYLVVMNDEDIPLLFFKSNVYIKKYDKLSKHMHFTKL